MKTFMLTFSGILLAVGLANAQATPAGKLNETPVERPVPVPNSPTGQTTVDQQVLNQATIDQRTTEEHAQDQATMKETTKTPAVQRQVRTETYHSTTTKPRPATKKSTTTSKTTKTTTRP